MNTLKPLRAGSLSILPAQPARRKTNQFPGMPSLTRTLTAPPFLRVLAPAQSEPSPQTRSSTSRPAEPALIYVVDDDAGMPELYTLFLKGTLHHVRTFNHREEAMAAIKIDWPKPDLLITDYLGLSIPIERFMEQCLAAHPSLRILMASGLSEGHVRLARVKPNQFIQKPFTAEEFLHAVQAALSAPQLNPA
jgi:CheY-like chemotaxis protein